MYGAILGDIIGQPYEFGGVKTTDFPLFGEKNTFTDDSVMTCAVADALMNLSEEADDASIERGLIHSMQIFGQRHPLAGYGGRFRKWLYSENPQPYNSFGNGSAMRVSSVAWLFPGSLERALHVAELTARVTHNHPEGIKAARAATAAEWLAMQGISKEEIAAVIRKEYYPEISHCSDIRPDYSFDVTAQGTMPAAFAAFFDGTSYEDVVRLGVSLGGDSDTIGAIAGGMAEAFYGMPHAMKKACRKKLTADLLDVLDRFDRILLERDHCI